MPFINVLDVVAVFAVRNTDILESFIFFPVHIKDLFSHYFKYLKKNSIEYIFITLPLVIFLSMIHCYVLDI